MFIHLQQQDTGTNRAGRKAEISVSTDPLDTNSSLLPGLALIPTPSGVA